MVEIVELPKLGLSERGELVEWKKAVGETVEAGETIAVIESDKAAADVDSEIAGHLLAKYISEGEEISIDPGTPVAAIGGANETPPSIEDIESERSDESSDDTRHEAEAGTSTDNENTENRSESQNVRAVPRAKQLARDNDVDLSQIDGTGPQGAIVEADVESFLVTQEREGGSSLTVTETRELSGTRKTIAERLANSARTKPHVMGTRNVSIERVQQVRKQLNQSVDASISLNDLIILAARETLRDFPEFNAHGEDSEHRLIEEINIGYAVDDSNGLIVPVLRDLATKSIEEVATLRQNRVQEVLDGEHSPEQLRGGTFTITNVGALGLDSSFSIINPPEVAILSTGKRKPIPFKRDDSVEFDDGITFALNFDHRFLDGGDAGRFMERFARYLEQPTELPLGDRISIE